MRKLMFGLMVLAGASALPGRGEAMPIAAVTANVPVLSGVPGVQPVQYYEDWRYREWRRREAFERWRRHEEWRRWRAYQEGYGRRW